MKIGYLMQEGVPDIRAKTPSGPARHVKQVIQELKNLNYQVCLLAKLGQQIWKSDDLENYTLVNVYWLDHGPLRLFERLVRRIQSELKLPYAAFFESVRFAMACRQELSDCNLFYERMGWMGFGGAFASRMLHIPLILEVNGDHLSELESLQIPPRGLQRWISINLTKLAVKVPAHVVTTGAGWRQQYIERWGVDPNTVSVIENGTELVSKCKRDQLKSFRETSGEEVPTIVYLGAFEPWHGITVLLQAVSKVIHRVPVKVLLIGTGSELNSINDMINTLGLNEKVVLTGQLNLDQVSEYLAHADIGIAPYCGRAEYSGLKLLDYKAAGLAIITSGADSQPSIIDHMKTGWVVPPCDPEALSEAIIYLVQEKAVRKSLGKAARLEAEKIHSWQHTAEELGALFTQVLATRA